ncbi:MAG: four helix bundle protein [Chitinophagaceae bacterium]
MEKGQRVKKRNQGTHSFFSFEEKFKLTDQLIRSSGSVNAIFADSCGRYIFKDQLHYCIMVRGFLNAA